MNPTLSARPDQSLPLADVRPVPDPLPGGFAIILCIFLAKYANLWLQAKMTSASITILELVGMCSAR